MIDRTTGQPIMKPVSILDYDKYMPSVDRCDPMITYPAFKRRAFNDASNTERFLVVL